MPTDPNIARSRNYRRLAYIKLEDGFIAELQDHESRRGELKIKTQAEVDALKQQIDDARTERDAARVTLDASRTTKVAAKAALVATRNTKQAERDALQIQLDAAVGAAAKAPIRAARDAVIAEIASLTAQIDALTIEVDDLKKQIDDLSATLDSLQAARLDALLEERYLKNQLTADDLPIIAARKAAEAADIQEKRQALRAKKLLDDPKAAERLAHRQKMKVILEQKLQG